MFCFCRADYGFVPGAGVEFFFGVPFLGVGEHLDVEVGQSGHVLDAACFEIFFLFEACRVFLRQERCGAFGELGGAEAGLHGVVIMRGNGIELVIVAAGALEGVGEEGFADAVGDVIEEALTCDFGDFHARQLPGAHAEEAGGDEEFGVRGSAGRSAHITFLHLVACDLLFDELIVGFVGVEAANDVVAVAPGVAAFVVVGEAAAVGVARNVQPVAGHAFAVVRGGEEAVD